MSDALFDIWWEMFLAKNDPVMRSHVMRAILSHGLAGPFVALPPVWRIGHRRWRLFPC